MKDDQPPVDGREQGISAEPHLRGGPAKPDESEELAERVLREEARKRSRTDELEHSVWDEPACAAVAGAISAPGAEYADWLAERRMRTSALESWTVALGIALVSGPLAILGVLLGVSGSATFQLLMIVLIGPVAEEVMKNALALYVVEKRPYLFMSRAQIAICALASGFVFAAIENVLYLQVYTRSPSHLLVEWRWTVCTSLHMGCALIYALGLMRIWRDVWSRRARARLDLGVPHAVAAMVLHGAYNAAVTLLEITHLSF